MLAGEGSRVGSKRAAAAAAANPFLARPRPAAEASRPVSGCDNLSQLGGAMCCLHEVQNTNPSGERIAFGVACGAK